MMSGLLPPAVFKYLGWCLALPCCSVSLDRCDLLVDLEGFHLMSVARTLVARSTLCWLSISGGEVIDSRLSSRFEVFKFNATHCLDI